MSLFPSPAGRKLVLVTLASVLLAGCAGQPSAMGRKPYMGTIDPVDPTSYHTDFKRLDLLPKEIGRLLKYKPLEFYRGPGNDSELVRLKKILDSHFVYVSDLVNYGQHRVWRAPVDMKMVDGKIHGDLEDYAIVARAMLLARGLPAQLAMTDRLYDGQMLMVASSKGLAIDRLQKDLREIRRYDVMLYSRETLEAPWSTKPTH